MAYRQYTKCISAGNYIGGQYVQVIIAAALAALPLAFGASVLPGVLLVVCGAIIAYCRWWLYDRLICLGGDVCAVGWILKIEPPSAKSGLDKFDTDYSINLVLMPHVEGATQAQVESDGQQGNLIANQPDIIAHSLDFTGHSVSQWANSPVTAVLHAEFEGAGVYDLMIAALVALGFAVAATIICAIPVIGWIVCLILSLIAAIILVVGIVVGLNDTGNPNDVNENLGELHENDPTGRGADIVVVRGTWVYDSAHEGWNEIHPIKHCQKIGTWEKNWSSFGSGMAAVKSWCDGIGQASDPLTVAAQQDPANQWTVHPDVDGCDPPPDVPR